jgi:murein DD-endopeptidase MepM/ murein hydrolase activator NlpD
MENGVVKALFKDYLGLAIIIDHEPAAGSSERLLSVYAHTHPSPKIEIGVTVNEGDIIATLADTGHSKANILPHLHFTLGLLSELLSYKGFVWNTIRNPKMITLIDPLAVIDWSYQAMAAGDPGCREL